MHYSIDIGRRHMRAKKSDTISIITLISILAVAIGVGVLLTVLSITSGMRNEFRNKVLGVNAHVIIMKYGRDFAEYRDVVREAEDMNEVKAASPFLFQDMMLTAGRKTQGVSVKGIDPQRSPRVLDLPSQIVSGSIEGLRIHDEPPTSAKANEDKSNDEWAWLDGLEKDDLSGSFSLEELKARLQKDEDVGEPDTVAPSHDAPVDAPPTQTNTPDVASIDDIEAMLAGEIDDALPEDFELPEEEANVGGETSAKLPGIVVGWALAQTMQLKVGDEVRLLSPLSGFDASLIQEGSMRPSSLRFIVRAIFKAGFQEYDTQLVYIDLHEAQRLFGQGDVAYGVELKVDDIDESKAVAMALEESLDGPYRVVDWEELNESLFRALLIQQVALTLVITTIVIVAAFMVIASMIMMVLEKKKEIAILKAMGASDGGILVIFSLQGIVIGIVGIFFGLLLGGGAVFYLEHIGIALDPKVYLIDHVPVSISPFEFGVTIATAFLICAIATMIPSLFAARMMPVDGLRRDE